MTRLFLMVTLILFSCQNKSSKHATAKEEVLKKDDNSTHRSENVSVPINTFDTLTFTTQEFNIILDSFPTLHDTIPLHPDIAYQNSGFFRRYIDSSGQEQHFSFGSEIGQDEFYMLYAYFLQKRQNAPELIDRRKTLWAIYQKLNSIFGQLAYGGTFFGHQAARINAYVEYDLYRLINNEDVYQKPYSILDQKNFYLAGLRQRISDEVEYDVELSDKASRLKRKNDLYRIVDELDTLITDFFYLSQAQEYQYSSY